MDTLFAPKYLYWEGAYWDNTSAWAEGWTLYMLRTAPKVRIWPYPVLNKSSASASIYHVLDMAAEGSEYHLMAIMFIRALDPEQYVYLTNLQQHRTKGMSTG